MSWRRRHGRWTLARSPRRNRKRAGVVSEIEMWFSGVSAVAMAVSLVIGGCASDARVSDAPPLTTPSSLPSSAISKERAVELAREHTSSTTLVSVKAGRFGVVNTVHGIAPGYPIKPDDLIWAVQFSGD